MISVLGDKLMLCIMSGFNTVDGPMKTRPALGPKLRERIDRRACATPLECLRARVKSKALCGTVVYVDLLWHVMYKHVTTGHTQTQRRPTAHDSMHPVDLQCTPLYSTSYHVLSSAEAHTFWQRSVWVMQMHSAGAQRHTKNSVQCSARCPTLTAVKCATRMRYMWAILKNRDRQWRNG